VGRPAAFETKKIIFLRDTNGGKKKQSFIRTKKRGWPVKKSRDVSGRRKKGTGLIGRMVAMAIKGAKKRVMNYGSSGGRIRRGFLDS